MKKYALCDGTEVSRTDIIEAVMLDKARIIYTRNINGNIMKSLALDGVDFDTRGKCFQWYEEAWTVKPLNVIEALKIAEF